MLNVNYLAVIAAVIANMALGMLWYGPLLGKHWMKAIKLSKKELNKMRQKNMAPAMAGSFIASAITAYILAIILNKLEITSLRGGAGVALTLSLGFIATTNVLRVLYENASWKLYFINTGYNMLGVVTMALIIMAIP